MNLNMYHLNIGKAHAFDFNKKIKYSLHFYK